MRILPIIFMFFILSGCSVSDPERPPSVPEAAVWSGGLDGGNWFNCDSKLDSEYNSCTVYADVTGVVLETGRYQLKNEKRAAMKNELQYSYFSAGEINLNNNKVLVRISE